MDGYIRIGGDVGEAAGAIVAYEAEDDGTDEKTGGEDKDDCCGKNAHGEMPQVNASVWRG